MKTKTPAEATKAPAPTSKEEAKAKAAELAKAKTRTASVLNSPAIDSRYRPVRPKTKRATVVEHLEKSAWTFEEMRAHFGWTKRNTTECLNILHNRYGYGFSTDPKTGKITAKAPAPKDK